MIKLDWRVDCGGFIAADDCEGWVQKARMRARAHLDNKHRQSFSIVYTPLYCMCVPTRFATVAAL